VRCGFFNEIYFKGQCYCESSVIFAKEKALYPVVHVICDVVAVVGNVYSMDVKRLDHVEQNSVCTWISKRTEGILLQTAVSVSPVDVLCLPCRLAFFFFVVYFCRKDTVVCGLCHM